MRTYLGTTEAGAATLAASTLSCAARIAMPGAGLDVSIKPESNLSKRGNHQWQPFAVSEPPV